MSQPVSACGKYIVFCKSMTALEIFIDDNLTFDIHTLAALIPNVIPLKALTQLYALHPETLAAIYWILFVVLKCYIEKLFDVSELYKPRWHIVGRHI